MTLNDAKSLKKGDLVYISGKRNTKHSGMILEVSDILYKTQKFATGTRTNWYPTIELKQPGFDLGWRIESGYRVLARYKD